MISRSVRPRRAYQTADGPRQLKEAVPGARGSILTPATHWVYTEVPICNRSGARTFYRHCRTTFYRARSGRQRHPRDSMGCIDNIYRPQTHSIRYLQVTQLRTARPMAVAPGGKRDDDRDLRARTVVHGDRSARRAARHHARLRTHDQNAPRGVSVRRRHRAHRSRNDCHATAERAKSRVQAPHRPACAAATAARSTATGRLGRPAASSSRPSTLVGSGERKESSLRPLERLEEPRELIGGHVSGARRST